MVRWMLGLGCLGAGTLLALEALYTIKTQKKKRGKKRKEKGLRWFFFNIIWCLFLIASRACKNIYLSFYLKEFFKKSLLGFIFLFLFTFAFVWGMIWSFFSSPPRFFFFALFICFVFFSYQKIGKPNVHISLFPTNHGVGQCCFAAHSMPRVTQFQLRAFFKAEHLQAKKSLERDTVTSDKAPPVS